MTPRRPVVEMMDDVTAEIMRQKTPAERLKIAFDMWDFAFNMIHANVRREHPDWTAEEVQLETARRIGAGGEFVNEQALAARLVAALEALGIPYFITGSMASIAQGEPRFTNDIDVVADIPVALVPQLLAAFPSPEFYLSEQAVREAISRRFQFNVIQITSGLKVDVMIPANDDFDRARKGRIVRLNIDAHTAGWFASPEDVILKKLCYYREGGSEKHLRDIAGLLTIQGERINYAYLSEWAEKLGVAEEMQLVRERMKEKRG